MNTASGSTLGVTSAQGTTRSVTVCKRRLNTAVQSKTESSSIQICSWTIFTNSILNFILSPQQREADHTCISPDADEGYVFSKAMKNPRFISTEAIQHVYLPIGFTQFKIEGRSLGSALVLEFLLYYLTNPEYQLQVREKMYLNSSLDLF